MELWSEVIRDGGRIPRTYTADGDNISPPLHFSDLPKKARELALILDDIQADEPRHIHWILYGIDPQRADLPEGILHEREPDAVPGVVQGTNSLGNVGYNGPQPPAAGPHRYRFRLIALDQATNLPPGATTEDLERAMEGHVIREAELRATYERPRV